MTNEAGVHTLKSRYGEKGAVAGPHRVGFEWADSEFDAIPTLRSQLGDADRAKAAEFQQEIDENKRLMKSRPKIASDVFLDFEGTAGGIRKSWAVAIVERIIVPNGWDPRGTVVIPNSNKTAALIIGVEPV